MKKVDKALLDEIDKQFDLLDEDKSGSLDWNDIMLKKEKAKADGAKK